MLLQAGQLLGQFGLDNSRPGASSIPASMQTFVDRNGVKLPIHYSFNDLPDRLQQAGSAVVAAAFGYQDDDDPARLLGNRACLPHRGDQLDQQAPRVTSSPAATRTSESVGMPSGSGTGVMLMGRGSPEEVLHAYSATRSAVWHPIVS